MRSSLLRFLSLLFLGSLLVPAFVIADSDSSSSSSSSVSSAADSSAASSVSSKERGKKKSLSPATVSCIQTAVDAREQAILDGLTKFTSDLQAAFSLRKTQLHDAWAMTSAAERKAAIKTAWQTFKQSKQTAQQNFKKARNAAWNAFRSSAKSCGETTSDENYKASENI